MQVSLPFRRNANRAGTMPSSFHGTEGRELAWSDINQMAWDQTSAVVTDRKHDFALLQGLWSSRSLTQRRQLDWSYIPCCWQIHTYLLPLSWRKPPSSPCGDPSALPDREWGRWLGHCKRGERIKEQLVREKTYSVQLYDVHPEHSLIHQVCKSISKLRVFLKNQCCTIPFKIKANSMMRKIWGLTV